MPPQQQPPAAVRRLLVRHATNYRYDRPIQRSRHRLHLRPLQNGKQTVSSYRLSVSPQVPLIEYEDVFGNMTARFEITQPYTELTVTAESTVELLDVDPFAFAALADPARRSPWNRCRGS